MGDEMPYLRCWTSSLLSMITPGVFDPLTPSSIAFANTAHCAYHPHSESSVTQLI